jgi:hypothetical protein
VHASPANAVEHGLSFESISARSELVMLDASAEVEAVPALGI